MYVCIVKLGQNFQNHLFFTLACAWKISVFLHCNEFQSFLKVKFHVIECILSHKILYVIFITLNLFIVYHKVEMNFYQPCGIVSLLSDSCQRSIFIAQTL